MPAIFYYEGDYVIHAPLDECIRFLKQFPPVDQPLIRLYNPPHTYAIDNQYQHSLNIYNYSILSYEGLLTRGYVAELDVRLEAIDDANTQLICVSQISPSFLLGCIIVIIFSVVFTVWYSPLSLLVGGVSCFQIYLGFRASDKLIDFHHNQWLMMPTQS